MGKFQYEIRWLASWKSEKPVSEETCGKPAGTTGSQPAPKSSEPAARPPAPKTSKPVGSQPATKSSEPAARHLHYTYGGRNMDLSFSPAEIILRFDTSSLLSERTERFLISDVLEKIYIIYTMQYSHGLDVQETKVIRRKYNGRKQIWEDLEPEKAPSTYLTNENLTASFMVTGAFSKNAKAFDSSTWLSEEWLQKYLEKRSTDFTFEQNNLKAAWYAWMVSKNKSMASERFQYLWIALNCLYFYFGRLLRTRVCEEFTEEEENRFREWKNKSGKNDRELSVHSEAASMATNDAEALHNFMKLLDLPLVTVDLELKEGEGYWTNSLASGMEIQRRKVKLAGEQTFRLIDEMWNGTPVTRESLKKENLTFAKALKRALHLNGQTDKVVYSYLLGQFIYGSLRCQVFHGSMPVLLFSPKNDRYRKAYELANGMLEDLIEKILFPCMAIDQKGSPDREEAERRMQILCGNNQDIIREIVRTEHSEILKKMK